MAPRWLRNEEAEADQKAADEQARKDLGNIEIKPEVISEAMRPHLDNFKTEFGLTIDEKLKAVNEFFAEQNRARQEATRRQREESSTPDDVDYFNDPAAAIDRKLQPINATQQAMAAMLMINETIGEMDYYKSDPQFKAKVLSKINSQPLQVRSNPDIIMNCYKLVRYDEEQNIKEGKYKSMIGAASTTGTGGHSGTREKEDEVTISDEEKVYAKKMGISETDWVKSKKTLEYV